MRRVPAPRGRRTAALAILACTALWCLGASTLGGVRPVAASGSIGLTPTQDTFATALHPGLAHGTWNVLRANGSPAKRAYLRFAIPSGNVTAAVLHLYVTSPGAGVSVRTVSSDAWSAAKLTYGNAPGVGSTVLGSGSAGSTGWKTYELTASHVAAGDLNLAVVTSTKQVDFSSTRGAHAPQLVITLAQPSPSPSPTAPPTDTPTASSTATATPTSTPTSTPSPSPTGGGGSLPQPVTDVTAYGAVGDGHTDSGAAVRAAMSAAEKVGGSLYFPAGHYLLSAATSGGAFSTPAGGRPLTIAGDSAATSVVTGLTNGAPVLGLRSDHVTVQDLTIDAQSHDLGASIYLIANYNTIQRCSLLGGSHFFGVYAAGDASGVNGNTGNQLLDDTISDRTQMPLGDGISWSYQHNSLIQDIDHTGSRLALYRDTDVTVTNYTYHPGPYANVDNGFWISAPSSNITVTDFTTYGNGGVMSANGGQYDTGVVISGEQFLGSGGQLRVVGATGLTVTGCSLGTGNTIEFAATVPLTGVVIKNCTSLPMVRYWDTATVGVNFENDTFPAPAGSTETFVNYGRGGWVTCDVNGGSWANQSGGFSHGGQTTYSVQGLIGYN